VLPSRGQEFDYRPLLAALLVGLGYYAGAKIGFALTFHPYPISVLWPPNAILLGAMLVTPVHWWWMLIAAALPAHLNAQFDEHVPTAMVMCWFVSNVSEALVGAVCIRRVLRRPLSFDSVRSVAVFIGYGALLAPFLSSFLDAAFVRMVGWGENGYWSLWSTRFFSNVLATLTIVPVIVSWTGDTRSVLAGEHNLARAREALALLVGLLSACAAVFNSSLSGFGAAAALLPLPFLLWAALRYGTLGASTALLIVAFTAIWGAGHGHGPFSSSSPGENAMAVRIFLTFLAVTLLVLAAAVRELTDSERRLRKSEQRFATAFHSSPDAMIISRRSDAKILEVNARWEEIFGYRREEALGRTLTELRVFPLSFNRDRMLSMVNEQGGVHNVDVTVLDRQGNALDTLISTELVEIDNESSFVTTVRDVTEQRQMEREAREQRQQLMHLTRVASLGELSGAIAHELNQPLTAILSNAQAARRFLAKDPVDLVEIREIVEDIIESDKRAGEVIRRLRAMLKKGETQLLPVDINDILEDVLDFAHGELVTHGVTVSTRLSSGLPQVNGDRVQLQQLFLNLITNACEAMSTRERSQRMLTLATTYDWDGRIGIAVTDSGWGVPPERLERLFEPFYSTKDDGLGLGLAICRTIVTAHHGRLWAENNIGGGATFRVTLSSGGVA
jgi:PAS domain S-box-containing protein